MLNTCKHKTLIKIFKVINIYYEILWLINFIFLAVLPFVNLGYDTPDK